MSNPYITTVVTCAVPNCGKTKQESNHWFLAFYSPGSPNIQISAWSDKILREYRDDVLPLCSESCASKLLSKFMSDQKPKEYPAPEADKGEPPL